jgi:hypothetical protein
MNSANMVSVKVSYTKLKSGEWGIRAESALTQGATVTVTKKSGETKSEIVGTKVWTDGKGVWLYAIAPAPAARTSGRGATYERGCGMICDECGERAVRGTRCWETGANH